MIQPSRMLWCCLLFMCVSLFGKRSRQLILVCLGCCSLAVFSAYHHKTSTLLPDTEYGSSAMQLQLRPDTIKVNGDLVTFTGKSLKDERDYTCRLILSSEKEQKQWQKETLPLIIETQGELEQGTPQRNLLGFDYRLYLEASGISGIYTIESYQLADKQEKACFLQRFRRKMLLHIEDIFSEKTRAYVKALLFGYQDLAFEEIRDAFSDSGLLHLFSLSGLHVQFFLGGVYYVLRRMKLTSRESFPPLCLTAFLFYFLTGGSMSVTRALIFFLVSLGVKGLGQHVSALDKFSISLILMLLLKPYVFFALSGLLSVVISLIILFLSGANKQGRLALVKSAFALQTASIPLIAAFFYEIPILAPLLGLVFIPVFEVYLLPLVFFTFIVSLLPAGVVFMLVPLHLLEGSIFLIEKAVGLCTGWTLPAVGNTSFALLLLLLVSIFFLQKLRKVKRSAVLCSIAVLCLPIYQKYLDPSGMVAFVDVGQGDSIFFKGPFSGETILIDTGGQLAFEREAWQIRQYRSASSYQLIPFLKSQGVRKLDKLIITHADEDHMGEVLNLNEEIKVKELYLAKGAEKNPKMKDILLTFEKQGTAVRLTEAGDTIGEHFQLKVLYPFGEVNGENNDSLVLWTKIEDTAFLLTGDLEREGEGELIRKYPNLKADVLKAGHHGSKTSSSADFVRQIAPKTAVISCGADNRFGHPHPEVLENLAEQEICRTDENGMVYFRWSFFDDLSVKTIQ